MQLSGNKAAPARRLAELKRGQEAVIEGFDLPEDFVRRLMEMGFLPGGRVKAGRPAPGGDPTVFEVDGSEVALRRETTVHIRIEFVS